jgi:hypothetical protein
MHALALKANGMESLREISEDPWLMTALGLGTLMTAGLFIVHACCFGADAAMLKSLSLICSSAV